jgi:hypothetical protein
LRNSPDELPDWFDSLIETTRGIREPKQRALKLLRSLETRDGEEIAAFFHHVSDPEKQSDRLLKRTHLDLIRCRDELTRLGYDLLSSVYEVASREEWKEVKALLRSSPTLRCADETLPEGFSRRLGSLTVGQRKQMGRDRRRKNIELLLFDSNPMVIRELLNNPRITERDVVRIASRHRAPPEVLDEICRADRWMTQYNVRKALVFNPQTPISFALGLLNHLQEKDLRLVFTGGTSRKELIEAARERLRSRGAR